MKRKIIFIAVMILLFSQCLKTDKNKINKANENNKSLITNNAEIDFNTMRSIVEKSNSLNIEVFVAISILHKNHIMQLSKEAENLSEDEQKKFYEQKKKEFFKSLKYNENQYNAFMTLNSDKINEYIASHKEIGEFLTSIN